jgi:hypothetical protein
LRRTTQRLVFGGGRSSLIGDCPIGDRAATLFTGPRADEAAGKGPLTGGDFLLLCAAARGRVSRQSGSIGGRNEALGRQHAGGRTPRDTVIANECCYRGLMLFLVHRYHS